MDSTIDIRLEKITGLLDQALASDDERIKDALRALLTVTVLCSEDPNAKSFIGPFKKLVDDLDAADHRISQLEGMVKRMNDRADRFMGDRAAQFGGEGSYASSWQTAWGQDRDRGQVGTADGQSVAADYKMIDILRQYNRSGKI